jgi:hypothetical protein
LLCSFYAQCITSIRADHNVADFGWDGTVLECGTPISGGRRRLLQAAGSYGGDYGSYGGSRSASGYGYGSYGGDYGSRDLPGAYGSAYGSSDVPETPAELDANCDGMCMPIYQQCGGGIYEYVKCCEDGLVCTKVCLSASLVLVALCLCWISWFDSADTMPLCIHLPDALPSAQSTHAARASH